MSDNPTKITSFGFKPFNTEERWERLYKQWPGRYRPHESHHNVSAIFTNEELQKLYDLVLPYQRAGAVRLGPAPGTRVMRDSPDKSSLFTVYRMEHYQDYLFQIEKVREEVEIQDENEIGVVCMRTQYSLKGDLWIDDMKPVANFKQVEIRVGSILETLRPRMKRALSLVNEQS